MITHVCSHTVKMLPATQKIGWLSPGSREIGWEEELLLGTLLGFEPCEFFFFFFFLRIQKIKFGFSKIWEASNQEAPSLARQPLQPLSARAPLWRPAALGSG